VTAPLHLVRDDNPTFADRIVSGLSSAEGLIWEVRDPIERWEKSKEKGSTEYQLVITDPGVDDKRLLVVENEFASPLKAIERQGNKLSPVVREAYDGRPLRTLVKHDQAKCGQPHISIIGHITEEELRRLLTQTEAANGFLNRFLLLSVRQSKRLPHGGTLSDEQFDLMARATAQALTFAQGVAEMGRDGPANDLWEVCYERLTAERPGLLGAATSRAEAHALRLSMLFALLDHSTVIKADHVLAGVKVWQYADRSAHHLFRTATGDRRADEVGRELVAVPGGLTKTQVRDILGRNRPTETVIDLLVQNGLAHIVAECTEGRPAQRVLPTETLMSSMSYDDWPDPPQQTAYYGLAGEIVREIEPHTESDPVAILVQYLVAFGTAVGRGPYVRVESDRHYTNEFALLVGKTSRSRKGTSWGHVRRIITLATGGQP